MVVAQHCECTQCHRIFHFKTANFMLREFHLNKNTCIKIKNEKKQEHKKNHQCKHLSIQLEGVGTHIFSTLGRDHGFGGHGLGALGTFSANLSAPWGPSSAWQEHRALKGFLSGL